MQQRLRNFVVLLVLEKPDGIPAHDVSTFSVRSLDKALVMKRGKKLKGEQNREQMVHTSILCVRELLIMTSLSA